MAWILIFTPKKVLSEEKRLSGRRCSYEKKSNTDLLHFLSLSLQLCILQLRPLSACVRACLHAASRGAHTPVVRSSSSAGRQINCIAAVVLNIECPVLMWLDNKTSDPYCKHSPIPHIQTALSWKEIKANCMPHVKQWCNSINRGKGFQPWMLRVVL